jgi:hypothetical protein
MMRPCGHPPVTAGRAALSGLDAGHPGRRGWVAWKYNLNLPETVVALLPTLGASYMAWAQFRTARHEDADR